MLFSPLSFALAEKSNEEYIRILELRIAKLLHKCTIHIKEDIKITAA